MFRPRIIPVLLLKGNGLVKTKQFSNPKYIGDPINAVKIFNDLEVDELVFLDINASKENRSISIDLVKQIGDEAFMPFGVGGGIKTVEHASALINAGAEKVVINTEFITNHKIVESIAKKLGSQSVVVSIDVKKNWLGKYNCYSKSGKDKSKYSPEELVMIAQESGAGEIIINSIENDGMMTGYDLEMINKISSKVNIPVVACGGAGKLSDLSLAIEKGAHAVAAGSIFVYHGVRNAVLINYPSKEELKNIFK